jgi:hypothetical protein
VAFLSESFEDPNPPPDSIRDECSSFSVEAYAMGAGSPILKIHGQVDFVTAPDLTERLTAVLETFRGHWSSTSAT